jgi:hypothetical protein
MFGIFKIVPSKHKKRYEDVKEIARCLLNPYADFVDVN